MTPKEQTRLQVLNSLLAEHMTLDQAATLMGVGPRHTRRMLAVYRERGAAALAHGHRGRRAPNATPDALAADVVHLAGTRYARANHTHLSELLSEREGIEIGRSTLRRILVNAGLSSPRQRRPPKHRVRRQRLPREGMLIQMDGSHHPWLGDQVPPFTLLIAVERCHRHGGRRHLLPAGGRPQLLPADAIPDRELRQTRRPVHRPARGLQTHTRLRPPWDAHPVQPCYGGAGDPDDLRPVASGEGSCGARRRDLPGPAGHRTPAGKRG